MHSSVKMNTPVEFINVMPLENSPLISRCEIKVCYVGEKPNRNGSIITKEVATEMAPSLRGCPIVGYYNETKEDFEGHNSIIDISNGQWKVKDTTKPYGFVDLNARVWFQKFLDDSMNEHEYLMTEGWLWTSQYPECRRILSQGNNQSMELDEDTLKANWADPDNSGFEFFIINEAMISKLCILGEDVEPCFEGANVTAPSFQFAYDDGFKEQLLTMMNELKEYLNKGGVEVPNEEIKDGVEEVLEVIEEEVPVVEEPQVEEPAIETPVEVEEPEEDKNEQIIIEETQEYQELNEKYSALTTSYEEALETISQLENKVSSYEALNDELTQLRAFKAKIEKQEKQKMIDSFYMLSKEEKADVIANIDTYSLEDIEAKLSIICVRNKVSFNLDEDNNNVVTTYNINQESYEEEVPAWVRALRSVANDM